MRTVNTYSLSNYQICSSVLLSTVSMLYITSPGLIYFITGSLYLLSPFTHFAHPPRPRPLAITSLFTVSVSLVSVCLFFRFYIQMRSYGICLSLSDFFHLFSVKYFYLTTYGTGICFQPRKIRKKKKENDYPKV